MIRSSDELAWHRRHARLTGNVELQKGLLGPLFGQASPVFLPESAFRAPEELDAHAGTQLPQKPLGLSSSSDFCTTIICTRQEAEKREQWAEVFSGRPGTGWLNAAGRPQARRGRV